MKPICRKIPVWEHCHELGYTNQRFVPITGILVRVIGLEVSG